MVKQIRENGNTDLEYIKLSKDIFLIAQYNCAIKICKYGKHIYNLENMLLNILLYIKATKRTYPSSFLLNCPELSQKVEFLLTNDCNLDCIYCYSCSDRDKKTMDFNEARKVIDLVIKSAQIKKSYFKKEGKISISFHGGGEPTIAFNIIKKITEYANCECNKKNIEVEYDITTNGIFSREVIMWLINNNYTIHFSMDGLKINQDMQRPTISGKSSFDIVAKNIDIAQNNSAKYTIRQTITKNNVGNIVKSIRYIIKRWKGVSSIKLAPLQQTNKSQENSIQGPNFTRYFSKIRKAIRILENNHMNTDGITGGVSSLINGGSCAATRFEQLIITPYGKITTCHEEVNSNQFIYGDVHNRVSINYKRVKELKNDDKKEIEEGYCSSCAYRMVCLGGCKHRRFSESRDFFCMLQREMYKLCILQLFRKGNLNGYFKIEKIRINEMNIELINFRQNRVK
ncbi:MAG TPA: radical SAM protein [Clostridia bacterium]|nr:radical SAM protein [Clostridia bacterium]